MLICLKVFFHTGKGGDIIQIIMKQKNEVGKIVYECKKVKNFDKKFIQQAKEARRIREADFAILVRKAFPSKKQFYFVENSIFVTRPISLEPITYTLRESLVRMAILKITNEANQLALQKIYNYLSRIDYNNKMNDVSNQLMDLGQELKIEIDPNKKVCIQRYTGYRTIFNDVGIIN